jgi:hypothetical protein
VSMEEDILCWEASLGRPEWTGVTVFGKLVKAGMAGASQCEEGHKSWKSQFVWGVSPGLC